ncbi:MAG: MFS transporter [SAR202 cluster bacterium]|jgi:MFS family permease|nr:MAG: MFS transporter [SAR202 cluster bacterium]KAA1303182.1 MAG: MFS transporter [SAR202 cluster bacterium]MEC8986408.1 MFS transporter [Chloroflexota bacterium]MEE3345763.1 MFS transporter [Chloroflexota bacterium]|tara:strand:- start:237 stop:1541 length:1305 start_codon:yes stop_codon:yes gene_type:complete
MEVPENNQSESLEQRQDPKQFFYGWYLVAVGVFLLSISSLGVFRGMSPLMPVLQKNFGWTRTQISLSSLLTRVEGAALGPIEGFLIDRIGARKMVLIGFSIMAVGFVLFSFIQNLWQFYAVFILINLGNGIGGWLAVVTILNSWFRRKRTIAMAGAMSGILIAGIFVPPYTIALNHGFRVTVFVFGLIILAVALPCVKIIKNNPEELGLLPDGAETESDLDKSTPSKISQDQEVEFTVGQALKTRVFWILTVAHVSSTISLATLSIHLMARLQDIGLSSTTASYIELVSSVVALPSLFVAGWLGDKVSKKYLVALFLFLQGISTIVLTVANGLPLALLFAVFYGIAFGGRIPLMTAIRGDYFGRKAFASIMGWSMLPNGILMAIAPVWAAWMFDTYGSYTVPFLSYAVINLAGALIMLVVKKPKLTHVIQHHNS